MAEDKKKYEGLEEGDRDLQMGNDGWKKEKTSTGKTEKRGRKKKESA